MRALLFLAVYWACFTPKRACASPASTTPPPSLITPAPVLHKRFESDFVGYALFWDGDISIQTCNPGYTYTYADGYVGCVDSLWDLGTECYYGSTIIFTGGGTSECPTACVTDFYFYSLDDEDPAWGIHCATRSTGWTVLHMSSQDLSSQDLPGGKITITQSFKTSVPPTMKESTSASTATSGSPSPTETSRGQKNNSALIGGAIAGSLVFLGLVIASVFFFLSKRRRPEGGPDQFAAHGTPSMGGDQSVPGSLAPFSSPPPPEYPQDKSPSVTVSMARKPVQQPENGVGEVHEACGEPVYANELPTHSVRPQQRRELG